MYFRDVAHQPRAIALLSRVIKSGRAPHGWLLNGPDGVGKEMAAAALAARLMCRGASEGGAGLFGATEPSFEPCGECESCRLLEAGNHPDFQLIHRGLRKFHPDRAVRLGKGLFLVVDLLRHFVIEPASKLPAVAARRVFIVRDAERMNEEAQNALLKTLEEPPGGACLILVTAAASRLLPTIRSRCATIPFDRLPREFVAQELQRRAKLTSSDASRLARWSDGRLGAAICWAKLGLLESAGRIEAALNQAGRVEAFGKELIEMAGEWGRKLMADGEGADGEPEAEGDVDADEATGRSASSKVVPTDVLREALKLVFLVLAEHLRDELSAAARRGLDGAAAVARLQAIPRAETMLDRNVAPQLACEALAIELSAA